MQRLFPNRSIASTMRPAGLQVEGMRHVGFLEVPWLRALISANVVIATQATRIMQLRMDLLEACNVARHIRCRPDELNLVNVDRFS